MTRDLTTGTPLRGILVFGLPLLVGMLFQQLYHSADALVVGRSLGLEALAAVGASGSIMFLLLGFTMGMANGFAIPISRAFGAGDARGIRRAFAVGTYLSAGAALVLTIVGVPLSRQLLIWMATPAELLGPASEFLSVMFFGSAALIAFNYLAGAIRALGDSTTPLYFLAASSVLNVGLVMLFINVLGMGVGGAALATVIAQLATALACLVLVARKMPQLQPRGEDWRVTWPEVRESVHMGLPMGFQMSIIAIGTLVLQYAVNGLGTDSVAAFATASRVDALAMAPLQAAGMATATYVAQNRGAQQWVRITRGVSQTAWMMVGVAIVVGALCIVFGDAMVRAFAGDDANAGPVMELAHTMLVVNGLTYVSLALLHVFRSTLQGMGLSGIPTFSGVVELVLRCVAALILVEHMGFLGAVLAAPLAWVGALIPLWMSWERHRRELFRRGQSTPAPTPAVLTELPELPELAKATA